MQPLKKRPQLLNTQVYTRAVLEPGERPNFLKQMVRNWKELFQVQVFLEGVET